MSGVNKVEKKNLQQIARNTGLYPLEAFEFVRHGLAFAVSRIHEAQIDLQEGQQHITGQQLCWGLRDFAIRRYGVVARAVLRHWNINRTEDFGRIVFAMVDDGIMRKTPQDSIHDFDHVYDLDKVFELPERVTTPVPPTFHI